MASSKFTQQTVLRSMAILLIIFLSMRDTSSCQSFEYVNQNGNCQRCVNRIQACQNCNNTTGLLQCTRCIEPFYFQNNTTCLRCPEHCRFCNNNNGTIICTQCLWKDSPQTNACLACPTNCFICNSNSGSVKCTLCMWWNFVDHSDCPACPTGCQRCGDSTGSLICFICFEPYKLIGQECFNCSDGCLSCSNINGSMQCTQCLSGFKLLPNKTCQEICGDQQVFYLPCDLPKEVANDGCTDQCQVEDGYQCQTYSSNVPNGKEKSRCWFIGSESKDFIQFLYTDKTSFLFENKVQIVFEISMLFPSCSEDGKLRQLFVFNDSKLIVESISFEPQSLKLNIVVGYSENLDGRPYKLLFRPSINVNSAYLYTPETYFSGNMQSDSPIFRLTAYSQNVFIAAKFIMAVSIVLSVLALATCFGAIFSTKLGGLQVMLVIQYTWLVILWLPHYLPIPTFMITYLRFVSGYNIIFQSPTNTSTAPQTLAFSLSDQSFASNYNLALLFTMTPLFFALHFKKTFYNAIKDSQNNAHKRYRKSLQLLMYGCFFNLQYFVSCIVIYFKGQNLFDPVSLTLMILQLCIYAFTFVRFIYKSASFNRFRMQFWQTELKYNHIAFHLVNLVGSVLLLSLLPHYPWAPTVPQLLLFLYTLINKPYKTLSENLRSMLNLSIMMNATAFKTYIWYAQPDHNSIVQCMWLILIQTALIGAIVWAAIELCQYWKGKLEARKAEKNDQTLFFKHQMKYYKQNGEARDRMLNGSVPLQQSMHGKAMNRADKKMKQVEDRLTKREKQQVNRSVKDTIRLEKAIIKAKQYKGPINQKCMDEYNKIEYTKQESTEVKQEKSVKVYRQEMDGHDKRIQLQNMRKVEQLREGEKSKGGQQSGEIKLVEEHRKGLQQKLIEKQGQRQKVKNSYKHETKKRIQKLKKEDKDGCVELCQEPIYQYQPRADIQPMGEWVYGRKPRPPPKQRYNNN